MSSVWGILWGPRISFRWTLFVVLSVSASLLSRPFSFLKRPRALTPVSSAKEGALAVVPHPHLSRVALRSGGARCVSRPSNWYVPVLQAALSPSCSGAGIVRIARRLSAKSMSGQNSARTPSPPSPGRAVGSCHAPTCLVRGIHRRHIRWRAEHRLLLR